MTTDDLRRLLFQYRDDAYAGFTAKLIPAVPRDKFIGIRSPDDADGILGIVPVRGGSVVTSGDYERGWEQDGVRYHHLLDPATGYPARTGLRSVSIIGPSATVCDALSTACFVLGEEKARQLLASQPGYGAVFARDDGTVTYTDGLDWQT